MRPSRTADRVALIDRLLRGKERVTLALLIDKLGVTERTVCRDLEYMKQKLGLPVSHTVERGYCYSRQVPDLAEPEPVAGPATAPSLPVRRGRSRRILGTIHEALYGRKQVWIEGAEPTGSTGPFAFHPFFLSKVLGEFLLFGYRPSDGVLMNLPLRYLEDVRLTPQTFESGLAEGPKVRESEGWAGKGATHEVRLLFLPEATWAQDLFFAQGQVVEKASSGLAVRFRTDDLARVDRLAAVLGSKVRVEVPVAP
jgi:hypothetical protein